MLKLKGITKIYDVADEKVVALDGVDIELRKSEFVSVLGPSGCGKTTLLNIIGGLDKYTEGTLEINGVSTAEYDDRDWDSYRNHSIGFVFQNYNLINHLTVLDNVALALTLVGTEKEDRTRLALAALDKVGLKNKALKKPSQLSGGQMQRVAIARALINDPDIILADEPTGALDSETSVQVMSLLKDISKTRLVVMVTHNAELARDYSTRIIRLFDGKIVGDTNPYTSEPRGEESHSNAAAASAVRFISGKLSDDLSELTNDELSKVAKAYIQTIGNNKYAVMTCGGKKYITPLTPQIKKRVKCKFYEKKALFGRELTEVERAFGIKKAKKDKHVFADKYASKPAMKAGTAFKLSFTNLVTKKFRTLLTAISGAIGILGIALVLALFSGLNGFISRQESALASNPITITKTSSNYEAIVDAVVSSLDGLDIKYDKSKVYIYKVVRRLISNMTKYNDFDAEMVEAIENIDPEHELLYDVYMNYGLDFNVVKEIPRYTRIFGENAFSTGGAQYFMAINTNSYWTQMPSEELVLEQYEVIAGEYPKNENELVLILDGRNQISDINLFFNGLDYESVSLNYKENDLGENATLDVGHFVGMKYYLIANDSYYNKSGSSYSKNVTTKPADPLSTINSVIQQRLGTSSYSMSIWRGDMTNDSASYTYNKLSTSTALTISGVIKLKDDVSVGVLGNYNIGYMSGLTKAVIQSAGNSNVVRDSLAAYMDSNPEATDMMITDNMRKYCYALTPSSISIYCRSFDAKTGIKARLDDISAERKKDGKSEVVYSDLMSVVLNIVKQFILIITCALLSLTAISLVVSALMIGIITYVSVLERTGEIGILRAIGARKIDVSRIFNAENIIIGFISGVLGVVLTYILAWPLGAIMARFTGISGLVSLPWYFALLLIALCMLLTFAAGVIPATMAKKKDPVKALRSE